MTEVPHDVQVNVLDSDILLSEFERQWRYTVHLYKSYIQYIYIYI